MCHMSQCWALSGGLVPSAWAYLWLIWVPRRLDMVSSRFCRRSAMFFTVLMRLVSGSSPADTRFERFTRNPWTCTHTRTATQRGETGIWRREFLRDVLVSGRNDDQLSVTASQKKMKTYLSTGGSLMMTQPVGLHRAQFFWADMWLLCLILRQPSNHNTIFNKKKVPRLRFCHWQTYAAIETVLLQQTNM